MKVWSSERHLNKPWKKAVWVTVRLELRQPCKTTATISVSIFSLTKVRTQACVLIHTSVGGDKLIDYFNYYLCPNEARACFVNAKFLHHVLSRFAFIVVCDPHELLRANLNKLFLNLNLKSEWPTGGSSTSVKHEYTAKKKALKSQIEQTFFSVGRLTESRMRTKTLFK